MRVPSMYRPPLRCSTYLFAILGSCFDGSSRCTKLGSRCNENICGTFGECAHGCNPIRARVYRGRHSRRHGSFHQRFSVRYGDQSRYWTAGRAPRWRADLDDLADPTNSVTGSICFRGILARIDYIPAAGRNGNGCAVRSSNDLSPKPPSAFPYPSNCGGIVLRGWGRRRFLAPRPENFAGETGPRHPIDFARSVI